MVHAYDAESTMDGDGYFGVGYINPVEETIELWDEEDNEIRIAVEQ